MTEDECAAIETFESTCCTDEPETDALKASELQARSKPSCTSTESTTAGSMPRTGGVRRHGRAAADIMMDAVRRNVADCVEARIRVAAHHRQADRRD